MRVRSANEENEAPVGEVLFPVVNEEELTREAQWLGRTVTKWLDEDWCEQQVHIDIGECLCEAYLKQRKEGKREATSILLQLSTDLLKVDYTEAFVNPFDVANKALEVLMFKHDFGVCCQSDQEKEFLENSLKDF